MEFKTFSYPMLITEKHLDTFGHVNNAVYLELYEEARWDMITKNGWGLDKVIKEKIGPIITSINMSMISVYNAMIYFCAMFQHFIRMSPLCSIS